MKRALILGANGQDGFYLTQYLKTMNYEVLGTSNRTVSEIDVPSCRTIGNVDIRNSQLVGEIVAGFKPDEIYNLAGISSVSFSFQNPLLTREVNFDAFQSLVRSCMRHVPNSRLYQACSSEMFGDTNGETIDEDSPLNPKSPYAESKMLAHLYSEEVRESGEFWISNGILFNHESPLRSERFVTRKITKAVADISNHGKGLLTLGNIEISRDWGHASDYVRAMHAMLQTEMASKFVVATGKTKTLREFIKTAFAVVDLESDMEKYISIDINLIRSQEVLTNRANPSKANEILEWQPNISFGEMVAEMVHHDLSENN